MSITKRKTIWTLLFIIVLFLFPLFIGHSGHLMTLFVMATIYAITAMSLNLLIGYGGQISIGHGGFLTIGAYTAALLVSKFDLSIFLVIPIAGLLTGIIGLVIGLPATRLSGHFLAVATLGFGLSVPHIALNWDSVTGGYAGLAVFRPSWLSDDLHLFYAILIVALLITWIIYNLMHSRLGRAFLAIRESEVAAQSNGINISFYKTMMFVISAFFTGLAGGLYAYWLQFVSPDDFPIEISFLLLAMIIVGGLGSIPGAIIGAVLFTILPELTSSYVGLTNLVIGVAIVIIILFRPRGIISIKELFQKGDTSRENEEEGAAKDVNI